MTIMTIMYEFEITQRLKSVKIFAQQHNRRYNFEINVVDIIYYFCGESKTTIYTNRRRHFN